MKRQKKGAAASPAARQITAAVSLAESDDSIKAEIPKKIEAVVMSGRADMTLGAGQFAEPVWRNGYLGFV